MGHYDDQYELNAWKIEHKDEELEIPSEMYDFFMVLRGGARKYGANNWLEVDGNCSDHKSMHASMFRHLAESSAGITRDKDSGLHPLLHLASRALMLYTRQKKGLKHKLDK
jgi:hypothetical protein